MCHSCGYNPCKCHERRPAYNWYNVENYPCNPCTNVNICKKKVPAKCTFYNGPALSNLGLNTNIDVELILASVNNAIGSLNTSTTSQASKILEALNDINQRIVAITGIPHANYTI